MTARRDVGSTVCLAMLTVGLVALAGTNVGAGDSQVSIGIYRIPYEDGTQVRVTHDHRTHQPPNRLDLIGLGSMNRSPRVVAAASGVVRHIVDEFNERQDARTARQCNNNYVWLEHPNPNGEWTKYSHLQQDSVRGKAKLNVGDTVQVGTYLGDEGDVGCASRSHLHFEVAVPRDPADPITRTGGFIKGENRVPLICGLREQVLVARNTYTAAKCSNASP